MSNSKRVLEMGLVFLPALLALILGGSLAGEDPFGLQLVIWVAYIAMLLVAYASLRVQGTNWSHLGVRFSFAGWRAVGKTFAQALLVFICAAIAFAIGAVVMASFLGVPEKADFSSYEYLQGNPGMLLLALAGVYIVSSFGEEVIFRGYLMTRCAEFFSDSKTGWRIAIAVSTLVFALIHYDWGLAGVVQSGFMGFVLAYAYVRVHRNLWVNIIAHGLLDTVLLLQIYNA